MYIKRFLIFILCAFYMLNIGAQDVSDIIHPSPSLQALQQYGDYPVEPYTGITNVSIPIWEVKSGGMTVPITINNHSSGRKVDDPGGALGIGWTLNCGGFISRVVNDIPDEAWQSPVPYIDPWCQDPTYCSSGEPTYYDWYYNLVANTWDWKPDIFSYSLPNGKSGKFIMRKNTSNELYATTIPYDPIKVHFSEPRIGTYNRHLVDTIIITDTDGSKYWFGKGLNNSEAYDARVTKDENGDDWRCQTGWYLISMLNSSGTHEINFEYVTDTIKLNTATNNSWLVDILSASQAGCWNIIYNECEGVSAFYTMLSESSSVFYPFYNQYYDAGNPSMQLYNEIYLGKVVSKITFSGGSVTINSDFVNTDHPVNCNKRRINSIVVDNLSEDIRKVNFVYQDENANLNSRLLSSLSILDANNSSVQKYEFDYYPTVYTRAGKYFGLSKDWWGYFNGANNTSIMPSFTLPYGKLTANNIGVELAYRALGSSTVNRNTSEENMKSGMLKTITYPTGGETHFEYQANRYGSNNMCGGLRISKITNKDNFGNDIVKTYSYVGGEILDSQIPTLENLFYAVNGYAVFADNHENSAFDNQVNAAFEFRTIYFKSQLSSGMESFQGPLVTYANVGEQFGSGGSISYDYRTAQEISYNDFNNSFEQEYDFSEDHNYITSLSSRPAFAPKYIPWKYAWIKPLLLSKQVGSIYEEYEYDLLINESINYNPITSFVNDFRLFFWSGETGSDEANIKYNWDAYGNDEYYNISGYRDDDTRWGIGYDVIESGRYVLKNKTVIKDGVEEYNGYYYEPEHLMLSKDTFVTSTGSNAITNYTYPFQESGTVYDVMEDRNMISNIISAKTYFEGTWQEKRTNFYQVNNMVKPQTIVDLSNIDEQGDIKVTFKEYDSSTGNVLRYKEKNGLTTNILWAYNKEYPVAKIVSESVEIIDASLRNSVNNITYAGSDIKSEINTDISDLESVLSDYSNDNDFQIYLYTYKPLVGMTSETGPDGRTTYYEYDDFGRLKYVKNHKGEILKKHEYNYVNK